MANQGEIATLREPKASRRQERADRILDATAELILRWGYDKTTIDDIARKAGVAKGTIYLHWKTREALFRSLMLRESLALGEDFKRRVAGDPAGATLRGIYKNAALALMKRPLMKAFFLGDMEIIGKLAQSEQGSPTYTEKLAGFNVYLQFLGERGLTRTDLSLREQIYTVTAVFIGFLQLSPLVPAELRLSNEEMADRIGETIHRTLESERPVPPEELRAISEAFMQYLDRIMTSAAEQYRDEIYPDPSRDKEKSQ